MGWFQPIGFFTSMANVPATLATNPTRTVALKGKLDSA
jgi:hypothetical protein